MCGVALAVCHTLDHDHLIANVQARGEELRAGLQTLVEQYRDLFDSVRGWGLINGMVLKPDTELKSIDIVKAAMAEGLLLVPGGSPSRSLCATADCQ